MIIKTTWSVEEIIYLWLKWMDADNCNSEVWEHG